MTHAADPRAKVKIVMHGGAMVGWTNRLDSGEVEAVLCRPKAESDKNLGRHESERKAKAAILGRLRKTPG